MKNQLRLFIYFSLFTFHFSLLHAQNDWLWGKYGKGSGLGNFVNIDNNGNYFLTGYFDNITSVEFGSYTLTDDNHNELDPFLVKYDKNGVLQWAKQGVCGFGVSLANYVTSTDGMGNAYLAATFNDTMVIGSYTLTSPYKGNAFSFLAKFDPNGNVLWAKQSRVTLADAYNGDHISNNYVCTDKNGNSYITGLFGDTVIFDNDSLLFGYEGNAFLVKYDANGNVKWARQSLGNTSTAGAEGEGLALDNFGNIYLTGYFVDTAGFGADSVICPYYTNDFFLTKYDSNGNVKWAKQGNLININGYGFGYGATCDQYGNVYVIGEYASTLILDKDTLISSSSNYTNFFVAKYDSSGNFKWAVPTNTPSSYGASAWGISSDTMGHIYVSGGIGELGVCQISIGNDTVLKTKDTSAYDAPAVLLKFDTAGHLICANIVPYAGAEYNSIASDPTGNYVYYGGSLITDAIFGQDTIDTWTPEYHCYPIIARWEECDVTLGVNNITANTSNAEVKVYPNPNRGSFTISLSNIQDKCHVEIYNMLGENMYQAKLNSNDTEINLNEQSAGIYLYRVLDEDGGFIGSGKIIVEK